MIIEYAWDPAVLGEVTAIPAAAIDENIRLTNANFYKVLLWLLRNCNGSFDASLCARAVGLSATECDEAVQYWIERGILSASGTASAVPVTPASQKPPAASAAPPANDYAIAKTPRPKAVKPQMKEVLARKASSPEFSYLVDNVSSRLGKPLSPGDASTLLYLYDTAGLPAEVVLMAVGFAVGRGKSNMRYIESMCIDWSDRGIDTIAAVDDHICEMEHTAAAWDRVSALLGIVKSPTVSDRAAAVRWVYDWKTDDDMIKLAYEICVKSTGKYSSAYTDKILGRWFSEGIDTAEKAMNDVAGSKSGGKKGRTSQGGKSKPAAEPSFDLNAYSEMLQKYNPVYKKGAKA